MAFDFNSLRAAWRSDEVLGKWNGVLVYACPKNQLRNVSQQYFYIVFDDNKITCFYINSKTDEEGDFDFDESDWYDYFDEEVTKSVFKYLEKKLKENK